MIPTAYSENEFRAMELTRAGRCIPFLRPHRWSRWVLIDLPMRPGSFAAAVGLKTHRQQRACMRCGRTERDQLSP